ENAEEREDNSYLSFRPWRSWRLGVHPSFFSRRQLSSEHLSIERERMFAQRADVWRKRFLIQASAVHRVHPVAFELFDALDAVQHRFVSREDADLAIHLAHLLAEVFAHDRRLLARLDEQVGRE